MSRGWSNTSRAPRRAPLIALVCLRATQATSTGLQRGPVHSSGSFTLHREETRRLAATRRRRVLIWHNRHLPWLPYLYAPVTGTLIAGFEAVTDLEIILGWGTKRRDAPAFSGNLSALQRDDIYIWVGMGADWELWQSPWTELRARGVRTVLYQVSRARASPECPTQASLTLYATYFAVQQTEPAHLCAVRRTGKWPIDELWDFSWHNLEPCSAAAGAISPPTLRYVPLGYLPNADVRQMNVSRAPRGVARPLFFFGDPANNPKRHACFKQLKQLLGPQMKHTYRAFDDVGFKRIVSSFDIHVNLHKACGDTHNPITFRVAKLLNARRLILSEHAHPKDEVTDASPHTPPAIPLGCRSKCHAPLGMLALRPIFPRFPSAACACQLTQDEYAGMLLFVDNMTHAAALYRGLARHGWREQARAAAARFRRKFQPVDIFRRAGIYESLGLSSTVVPSSAAQGVAVRG